MPLSSVPSAVPSWKPRAETEPGPAEPEPMTGGTLAAAGFTDCGRCRSNNEDCFRVEPALGLLVIADGMGGHAGGEVAARMAVGTVAECVRHPNGRLPDSDRVWPFGFDDTLSVTGNRLRTAFQAAHLRLLEASLLDSDLAGMGTTLVAALAVDGRLTVAWAGDSRLYVVDSRGLRQVTADDSWIAARLRDDPDADRERLLQHPLRNALTNVVGTTSRTNVHVVEVALTPGMTVVLTTDGVHGSLQERHIAHLVSGRPLPADAAADLVAAAIGAGSSDNCTAIVARWSLGEPA